MFLEFTQNMSDYQVNGLDVLSHKNHNNIFIWKLQKCEEIKTTYL